jgi:hypothetical protein
MVPFPNAPTLASLTLNPAVTHSRMGPVAAAALPKIQLCVLSGVCDD